MAEFALTVNYPTHTAVDVSALEKLDGQLTQLQTKLHHFADSILHSCVDAESQPLPCRNTGTVCIIVWLSTHPQLNSLELLYGLGLY